jgi:hypothetical protein
MAVSPKKRITFRSRLNAIRRTRQLVSDQITILDLAAPDGSAPPGEMVTALTGLVKLLESLQRLERCHRNEVAHRTMIRRETFNDHKLREEIARRIDVLCTAREDGGGPRGGEAECADARADQPDHETHP